MDILGPADERISMARIVLRVAKAYDVEPSKLLGQRRFKNLVQARFEAMYQCKKSGWTLTEIGEFFHRDHTSVINAVRRHQQRLDEIKKARTEYWHSFAAQ